MSLQSLHHKFRGKESFCKVINDHPTSKSRDGTRTFDIDSMTVDNNRNIYYVSQFNLYKFSIDTNEQTHLLRNSVYESRTTGLAFKDDTLYICKINCHYITKYDVISGNTSVLKVVEKSNRTEPPLVVPRCLAFDNYGNLLFTEENRIRKIDMKELTVETVSGSILGYRDGDATRALFESPYGIAVGRDDAIFVCDENHCVRQIKNGLVSTIAGTPGQAGFSAGPLDNCHLYYPRDLVVDSDGSILVRCHLEIRKLDMVNKYCRREGSKFIVNATALTTDKQGTIYVGGLVIYQLQRYWIHERFLWLGHLKEDGCYCPLARLPKDLVKEIGYWIKY